MGAPSWPRSNLKVDYPWPRNTSNLIFLWIHSLMEKRTRRWSPRSSMSSTPTMGLCPMEDTWEGVESSPNTEGLLLKYEVLIFWVLCLFHVPGDVRNVALAWSLRHLDDIPNSSVNPMWSNMAASSWCKQRRAHLMTTFWRPRVCSLRWVFVSHYFTLRIRLYYVSVRRSGIEFEIYL